MPYAVYVMLASALLFLISPALKSWVMLASAIIFSVAFLTVAVGPRFGLPIY